MNKQQLQDLIKEEIFLAGSGGTDDEVLLGQFADICDHYASKIVGRLLKERLVTLSVDCDHSMAVKGIPNCPGCNELLSEDDGIPKKRRKLKDK